MHDGPLSATRVMVLGPQRGLLPHAAVAPGLELIRVPMASRMRAWPLAGRRTRRAAGAEAPHIVHLTDIRLAGIGRTLRRSGIAVTADVTPGDLAHRRLLRSADSLDALFVTGEAGAQALRQQTRRVAVCALPLAAVAPPPPSERAMRRLQHRLRRTDAASLVVVVPWRDDAAAWRMFRDVVLPRLDRAPVYVVPGMTGGRARIMRRELAGRPHRVVMAPGALGDDTIAALARAADAVLLPWTAQGAAPGEHGSLGLAFAAAGVPVIAVDEPGQVLEHERSAFLVRAGDGAGFAATLGQLLRLPPKQRHYLGEDFAARAMARWPAAAALAAYAAQFAMLAGTPHIPLELRAA